MGANSTCGGNQVLPLGLSALTGTLSKAKEKVVCLLDLPSSLSLVQDLTGSQLSEESGKCILQNLCPSVTKHSTELDLELEDNSHKVAQRVYIILKNVLYE